MAWRTSASSFESISRILNSPNCQLLQLLQDENIKPAIKKQVPKLIDFLLDHCEELADYALDVKQCDWAGAQQVAFTILITQVHAFSSELYKKTNFLQHLYKFISQADPKKLGMKSAASFSRIVQFLIQTSSCDVLTKWPEREDLFSVFLKHINQSSMCILLELITNDSREEVFTFLENADAMNSIIEQLSDDEERNLKLFKYMTNIIRDIDSESNLLEPFESQELVESLLQRAINSKSPLVSGQIFKLLFCLTGHCKYSDDGDDGSSDPLNTTVFKFLSSKLPEICAFVQSSAPFITNKGSAIELINGLTAPPLQPPKCVLDLTAAMFDQLFANPYHTILHRYFMTLFDRIFQIDSAYADFMTKNNVRHRIVEVWGKRKSLLASYWGFLVTMSEKIQSKSELLPRSEEWSQFLTGPFSEEKDVFASDYGGPFCDNESIDSDSDDFDFPIGDSELQQSGKRSNDAYII